MDLRSDRRRDRAPRTAGWRGRRRRGPAGGSPPGRWPRRAGCGRSERLWRAPMPAGAGASALRARSTRRGGRRRAGRARQPGGAGAARPLARRRVPPSFRQRGGGSAAVARGRQQRRPRGLARLCLAGGRAARFRRRAGRPGGGEAGRGVAGPAPRGAGRDGVGHGTGAARAARPRPRSRPGAAQFLAATSGASRGGEGARPAARAGRRPARAFGARAHAAGLALACLRPSRRRGRAGEDCRRHALRRGPRGGAPPPCSRAGCRWQADRSRAFAGARLGARLRPRGGCRRHAPCARSGAARPRSRGHPAGGRRREEVPLLTRGRGERALHRAPLDGRRQAPRGADASGEARGQKHPGPTHPLRAGRWHGCRTRTTCATRWNASPNSPPAPPATKSARRASTGRRAPASPRPPTRCTGAWPSWIRWAITGCSPASGWALPAARRRPSLPSA